MGPAVVAQLEKALNEWVRASVGTSSSISLETKTEKRGDSRRRADSNLVCLRARSFVTGSRPTQVLPHSPLPRREFTQKLAEVYRLQTDMVDQDPVRS